MSGFLLDTCVLSEFKKQKPDTGLVTWLEDVDTGAIYISSLTIGELRYGIARLPSGKKRADLETWLKSDIIPAFADRILPIDHDVADRWGRLRAEADSRGETLSPLDGFIAATAFQRNLYLVTRNEKHFPRQIEIVNPWALH